MQDGSAGVQSPKSLTPQPLRPTVPAAGAGRHEARLRGSADEGITAALHSALLHSLVTVLHANVAQALV